MKVYIAGTLEERDRIKEAQKIFREAGHEIEVDWTTHKWVAEEPEAVQRKLEHDYSIEDVDGVRNADVFILMLGERKSSGAHVELGIALGAKVPNIYIVGEIKNSSLFYAHPDVKHALTIEEVLSEINK